MKCTDCALELDEEVRFCPQCGQSARQAEAGSRSLSTSNADSAARQTPTAPADSGETENAGGGKVLTSPFPPLPETADAPLLPVTNVNGQMVHALLAQANLHRMRRQWEEAVECCVTVLRAQPANQNAHILLGDVYRDQRKLDEAVQWYTMALELRPNPTDQAKLDQVIQERERFARYEALRARRGYGNTTPSPIDRDTDLNTGTVNLMGLSPRRWLRGITATSLAFLALVLVGLIWTRWSRPETATAKTVAGAPNAPSGNTFGLPPHRLDKTPPPHLVAQAANGDKTLVVGGAGLPPDRGSNFTPSPRAFPAPPASTSAIPTNGTLPGGFGAVRPVPGMTSASGLPVAPVQNVRPMPPPQPASNEVAAAAPPSSRLSEGLQFTQTLGDGGVNATVLLTGSPSLALDGSPRGQETLVRNAYRAARTAFAGNTLLMRVRVMVQTQIQGTGLASVMEAEVDRGTAMNSNPDKDDAAGLQSRLLSYRWTGANVAPPAAPGAEETNGTQ